MIMIIHEFVLSCLRVMKSFCRYYGIFERTDAHVEFKIVISQRNECLMTTWKSKTPSWSVHIHKKFVEGSIFFIPQHVNIPSTERFELQLLPRNGLGAIEVPQRRTNTQTIIGEVCWSWSFSVKLWELANHLCWNVGQSILRKFQKFV